MGFNILSRWPWPTRPDPQDCYELALAIAAVYTRDPQRMYDVSKVIGLGIADFLDEADPLLPDTAIFPQEEGLCIAIAGTSTASQWAAHLRYCALVHRPERPAYVHSFWQWAYEQALQNFSDRLVFQGSGRKVVITGHSYGGAMAQLLARAVAAVVGSHNVTIVTFGQPRVGWWPGGFNDADHFFRIQNQGDPIPCLPPLGRGRVRLEGGLGFGVHPQWDQYFHYGEGWTIVPDRIGHGSPDNWFRRSYPAEVEYTLWNVLGEDPRLKFPATRLWGKIVTHAIAIVQSLYTTAQENHLMGPYLQNLARLTEETLELWPAYWEDARYLERILLESTGEPPEPQMPPVTDYIPPADLPAGEPWDGAESLTPGELSSLEWFEAEAVTSTIGAPIVANEFRGYDRRMLKTLKTVLQNLKDHDEIRAGSARSTAISTRTMVFDPNVEGLVDAVSLLQGRVDTLLAQQS